VGGRALTRLALTLPKKLFIGCRISPFKNVTAVGL
jgi:hypothetical protein